MILTGFSGGGERQAPPPIDQNIIMGLLMGVLYGAASLATAKFIKKKFTGTATEADKLKQAKIKNVVTNATLVGTTLMFYYFGNPRRIKPAAVIAGIPIGTAEELSHALSDRMLKYRATGGVFLAHQGGGNESLRIVAKAWGRNRFIFLTLIDFLFLYGSSRVLDLFGQLALNATQIRPQGFFNNRNLRNPWTKYNKEAIDEGREEYHLTFPIVTRNRIYTSMYIETYDVIESVENGRNMLTISLFFRKYLPPLPPEFVRQKGGDEDKQIWYKRKDDSLGKTVRFIDAVLDYGLTIVMQLYRYQQAQAVSAYTPEQMVAITFATGLDKALKDQSISANIANTSTQLNILELLMGAV